MRRLGSVLSERHLSFSRSVRWGLFLVLVVSPVGCMRNIRSVSPPRIQKDASLEELLALYELRYRALTSVKALVKVQLDSPSLGSHGFQAALLLLRPQTFQLTGFDPFGGTLFDLVSRGGERRLIVSGRDQSSRWGELINLGGPIEPGFFDFLGIPRVDPPELAVLEKGQDAFNLLVVRPGPAGSARLRKKYLIEREEFRAVQTTYYTEAGFPETTLFFSDFRRVNGFWLPFMISGQSRLGRAEFAFTEIKTNPEGARRSDAATGD